MTQEYKEKKHLFACNADELRPTTEPSDAEKARYTCESGNPGFSDYGISLAAIPVAVQNTIQQLRR